MVDRGIVAGKAPGRSRRLENQFLKFDGGERIGERGAHVVAGEADVPLIEGLDALRFGGAGFFGLRGSLLLLRWPLAMAGSFGYLRSDAMLRLACARASWRFEYRQSG
jgi:hypothetical protein